MLTEAQRTLKNRVSNKLPYGNLSAIFNRYVSKQTTSTLDIKLQNHYNIIMKTINFSWDKTKAKSNLIKHKVSFEEAKTVFDDKNARLIYDPDIVKVKIDLLY
jgi:hypothetical protein